MRKGKTCNPSTALRARRCGTMCTRSRDEGLSVGQAVGGKRGRAQRPVPKRDIHTVEGCPGVRRDHECPAARRSPWGSAWESPWGRGRTPPTPPRRSPSEGPP